MNFLRGTGRRITAAVLAVIMTLSLSAGYAGDNKVKAAGNFPVSGVHKGTLTHGSYKKLTGLYTSTNAKVCEADTMNSEGDSRAAFCLSPGVSETTKKDAYKSATYNSGYGVKYYKALIAFYYDNKDGYKTDAVRFATQFFVWRTVVLERNHKGNFAATAYDGNGFKSGFISTMKNLMGYSDNTAKNLYDKAYDYIKKGSGGDYNNKVALLKWTAAASQTMLTGKVYSNKEVKIKINKDLDQSGTGISLAGIQYEIREGKENGTKVGTFTLDKNGIDTVLLKKDGVYSGSVTYYMKETKNVAGTTSNKNNAPVRFEIDWGKIKDGASGGTLTINKNGVSGTKPLWAALPSGFANLCKNQLIDRVPHISVDVEKKETGTGKNLSGAEFTIHAYNAKTGKYDTKVTTSNNLGHAMTNPIVTGADGKAKSAELYYTQNNLGKFKITETKAPDNHVNDCADKMFSIRSGNGVTEDSQTLKYGVTNTTIPRDYQVTLKKVDQETGTPIYDAEFQISVYKNKVDNKYYRFGTVEAGTPQYDMYWAETKKIAQELDNDGKLTNTFKTDYLKSNRTYQIVETKRPTGYSSSGGYWGFGSGVSERVKTLADYDKYNMNMIIVFHLNNDGTIEILDSRGKVCKKQKYTDVMEISNNQVSGEVTVVKKDDKTGETLSGASFELWEVTKDEYNTKGYVPNAENGDTLTATGETETDGKLTFGKLIDDNDADGNSHRENGTVLAEHYYIAVETKAPDGYRLPANNTTKIYIGADEAKWTGSSFANAFEKTYVIENHEAKLDLNLHKVSVSRTGKESVALKGARFALYKVQKIVTDETSSDDNTLEDSNNNGIDNATENTIKEDTTITSKSSVGAAKETSDSVDYSELSNENYIEFDYSTITPVVADITTDEKGNAVVPEILQAGGYVLVETQAPKNYMTAEPQYIFIDNNTLYSTTSFEIEVQDKEFEAMVRAVKVNEKTGERVKQAGVGFKVKNLDTGKYVEQTIDTYKDPEVEGAPHELIKSEVTDTFYTDKEGVVTLPNVLACGHYQLEEVIPPKGFLLNETPIKFTVDDEEDYYPDNQNKQFDYDENTRDVVINLTCEDTPTTVELSKQDITTGKELPGAHLSVWYEENGKKITVDEWISKDTPHIIYALVPERTYHMTEKVPAPGYATAEDVVFKVKETADVQKVVMKDDTIKIKIIKVDSKDNNKRLPNAEFAFKSGGKTVATVKTDKNGEATINGVLIAGKTYVVSETTPPEGYQKKEDFKYTVKDTGNVQVITVKNERNGDATPNTPNWRDTGAKSPKTGDFSKMFIWLVLLMLSVGTSIVVSVKLRKEYEKE